MVIQYYLLVVSCVLEGRLNIDGTARFGIVWNNTRWYAGTSAILHAYNYRRSQFSTNNLFGNINIYAGFNFGRKGKKKKNKAK